MSKGIFAFYGVSNMTTLNTLSSYTNTFRMPYVTPDLPINITTEQQAFILRMQPTYGRAMRDVVKHFHWTRVYYIYDVDDGEFLNVTSRKYSGQILIFAEIFYNKLTYILLMCDCFLIYKIREVF